MVPVMIFLRTFSHRISVRSLTAATTLVMGALILALLVTTAPALALVTTVGGQKYGIQRHATAGELFSPEPLTVFQYGSGPVMHANATYAIYWDPSKLREGDPGRPGKYHGDWQQLTNRFLFDVGAESGTLGNVFSLTPQYPEANGQRPAYSSIFHGGYADHDTYPANGCTDPAPALNENFACFTSQQVREELRFFTAANQLHAGLGTIFFLLTPPGVTICTDAGTLAGHCSDSSDKNPWAAEGEPPTPQEKSERESYKRSFCSYHAYTESGAGETLVYAVIPWTAGTLGSAIRPIARRGSDCQDGTSITEEPNQEGLSPDGSYDHALPDVLINQIAAEQMATITDPLFSGWTEPFSGNEAPDQCRNWFEGPPVVQGTNVPDEHTKAGTYYNQTINGHNYYLNTEYNQSAQYYDYPGLRCELHANLVPSFTVANPVNAGETVAFDGNESDIALEQSADANPSSQPQYRATFSWSFGDGTTASGPGYSGVNSSTPLYASTFHSYQYGGTYEVTLSVTDVAGHTAVVTKQLTVAGAPAPSGEPGKEGSPPGATTPAAPAGAAPHTTAAPAGVPAAAGTTALPPKPIASSAVVSKSLSKVLREGLVVRYSVNEQVAGRFEVLLSSSIAHRLGIHGPRASGLPAGSAPSIVIGKAILVTTKGGHSTVKILFGKDTAARLRKLRKVSLVLRMVVRSGSSRNSTGTTVISTVTLHR